MQYLRGDIYARDKKVRLRPPNYVRRLRPVTVKVGHTFGTLARRQMTTSCTLTITTAALLLATSWRHASTRTAARMCRSTILAFVLKKKKKKTICRTYLVGFFFSSATGTDTQCLLRINSLNVAIAFNQFLKRLLFQKERTSKICVYCSFTSYLKLLSVQI